MKEESEKAGLKLNIQKTKIMETSPITSWQIDGETMETVIDFIFWAPKSLQMMTAAMKLKGACSLEEKLWNLNSIITSRDITLPKMVCIVKAMFLFLFFFPSSHVQLWELDHKEGWVPEKWCFWSVVLEKTLESPLDCKVIKLANPKGNQSWILTGRTDAKAPILSPPDKKTQLIGKYPDAGKDWRQEKGMTENNTAGSHHWLKTWA